MICKKNKLTHTHKNKLTHTRQTYQTIYTQMQNLEYNNVYIQKTRWRMYCYLQTNESDGLKCFRSCTCAKRHRLRSHVFKPTFIKVLILVQIKVKFIKPMYITTLEQDSSNSTIWKQNICTMVVDIEWRIWTKNSHL